MSGYPQIVYKYRDWSNDYHKETLTKNHLFLSPPIYFNDPFDCRIPEKFSLLDTKEKIRAYSESYVRRHYEWMIRDGLNPVEELKKIEQMISADINKIQNENDEYLFKMQDDHWGVLSLSGRWDSILMWAHYANFHKGFCVGFYEEKMRNSGFFGKGGNVTYYDDFPEISPLSDNDESEEMTIIKKSFIQTHSKAKNWGYEAEYRLTKLFFPNKPTDDERTVAIKDDFFAEIIIGITATDTTINEISKIAKEKKIKVFKAYKVPFKFRIDREEIK